MFAFPAQSNFSGVQHPLAWIAQAQAAGYDVLLDAAAFAPASRLDLSRWHPDYVALSFYKIFGYPTGIGALLVRKPALAKLRRPWYAGGTITFSSVRAEAAPGEGFYLTPGPAGFEDGTVDYLGIPAVGIGLDHISSAGIETIHTRVMCLTGWLLDALERPAAQQRDAGRAHLRPGRHRPPRRDDRDELLRPRRRAHRLGAGRAPGQPGGHLAAQRLPLQPRRARGRARLLHRRRWRPPSRTRTGCATRSSST